jgi:hypothetical protein
MVAALLVSATYVLLLLRLCSAKRSRVLDVLERSKLPQDITPPSTPPSDIVEAIAHPLPPHRFESVATADLQGHVVDLSQ